MDPRKKKEESLKHDRRNTYGENDKSSRKAIRRHKREVNQTYRHSVKQVLAANDPVTTEDDVAGIRRPDWKKSPDQPLGDIFLKDLLADITTVIYSKSFDPILFDRLEYRMEEDGWEKPAIRVVIRQLKTVHISPWAGKLNIDLQTARKLVPLFKDITADLAINKT